jgi:chromate transporter
MNPDINPVIYFLLIIKGTLFSTGGFTNLPSIRQDLLARGWASDADFTQSIAVGQISPGPNGLWVVCLGYLVDGYVGAALSLLAVTLPPLLVLVVAWQYHRIERRPRARAAMIGVSHAVVALMLSVVWTIIRQPGVDTWGLVIALGAFGLTYSRRVPVVVTLAAAAGAGYLLYR